jgi:hypothetical protein
MAFTQTDITNLLSILQPGRQNAQTALQIETSLHQQFGFAVSGNQHLTRALIKFAITNGNLIKSSTANPPGFWLSTDKNEIRRNVDSLRRRAQRVIDSANALQHTWNTNNPTDPI